MRRAPAAVGGSQDGGVGQIRQWRLPTLPAPFDDCSWPRAWKPHLQRVASRVRNAGLQRIRAPRQAARELPQTQPCRATDCSHESNVVQARFVQQRLWNPAPRRRCGCRPKCIIGVSEQVAHPGLLRPKCCPTRRTIAVPFERLMTQAARPQRWAGHWTGGLRAESGAEAECRPPRRAPSGFGHTVRRVPQHKWGGVVREDMGLRGE